jgi:RNA polymerase sigma factor (sigma-70 family)
MIHTGEYDSGVSPDRARAADDVALTVAGDRAAFERVYHAHVGRVYSVCLRMVADRQEAEYLTQDTFVRAWQKLAQFRGDSSISTWLHRLAVNVVLNAQRAERRQRTVASFDEGDDTIGGAAARAMAAPVLTMSGERVDLERAIAKLPPVARRVVVLHLVEGYGHREIGAILGISENNSKARLHRARGMLRQTLGGGDGCGGADETRPYAA